MHYEKAKREELTFEECQDIQKEELSFQEREDILLAVDDAPFDKIPIMQTHEEGKLMCIRAILSNPVYMKDAGMIKNLEKALLKMSLVDLENLSLVISLGRN
jgi:hypothetical protein